MTPVEKALRMLREDRRRDLYESAARQNPEAGSGEYYITYGNGESPRLYRSDIDVLLREGTIRPKWKNDETLHCYVLSEGVPSNE